MIVGGLTVIASMLTATLAAAAARITIRLTVMTLRGIWRLIRVLHQILIVRFVVLKPAIKFGRGDSDTLLSCRFNQVIDSYTNQYICISKAYLLGICH